MKANFSREMPARSVTARMVLPTSMQLARPSKKTTHPWQKPQPSTTPAHVFAQEICATANILPFRFKFTIPPMKKKRMTLTFHGFPEPGLDADQMNECPKGFHDPAANTGKCPLKARQSKYQGLHASVARRLGQRTEGPLRDSGSRTQKL